MNKDHYDDRARLLTTLAKMSKECGKHFSKGWYYKITDPEAKEENLTYEGILKEFHTTFCPFDMKAKLATA